jgi:pimeloyl-ACP methyl ester carboxylesterase
MVALIRRDEGDRLLPRLIRYVEERRAHQPRFTAGLVDYPGPMVVAWGDLDPIAVPAMADRLAALRSSAGHPVDLIHWPDVGHWPSTEAPTLVADLPARLLP